MMQLISHLHIKQPQIEMCGQHPCLPVIWLEISCRVKRRNGGREEGEKGSDWSAGGQTDE